MYDINNILNDHQNEDMSSKIIQSLINLESQHINKALWKQEKKRQKSFVKMQCL